MDGINFQMVGLSWFILGFDTLRMYNSDISSHYTIRWSKVAGKS